jgi:hypothetical protein
MNLSDIRTAMFGSEAHVSQLAQILHQHSDVSLESAELVQVISSSQLEPSVHAEMKILAYLHQKDTFPVAAYIGIKKEPRQLCEYSLKNLMNEQTKRNLRAPAPSKRFFPKWTLPNAFSWEKFLKPVKYQWQYFCSNASNI